MHSPITMKLAKAALRKEIKQKLNTLSSSERRRQSQQVLKKLINLPVFQNSKRISLFLSTDDEVSTEEIIKNIFDNNKQCYVPRYHKDVMQMVKLHSMKDWAELPLTKWNIKQPKLNETRENALESGGLDLVIVPGVAFTEQGKRLGHGKGYYDKFLTSLINNQATPAVTIALAFKEQVLQDVPTNEQDVNMDYVLYSD